MPVHIVARNETLMRIAAKYGFLDYRTIYDHPDNAALKSRRPNPQVLKQGDEVFIPEPKRNKVFYCETGKKHEFVIPVPTHELRIYALNGGKPVSCQSYILEIDGKKLPGRTKNDGLVKKTVPARARNAVLRFPACGLTWTLKIGALDPLRDQEGIQQRLANLGFWREGGETPGATFRTNLLQFQRSHELELTGEPDPATIAKLKEVHDKGFES
jgi:hypothetical protein